MEVTDPPDAKPHEQLDEGSQAWYRRHVMSNDLLTDALHLSAAQRAELAAALLASLDGEPDVDADAAWTAELERRAARVMSGEAAGRPWSEVREDLARRRK